jgi:hypothetical protein
MMHNPRTCGWKRRGGWVAVLLAGAFLFTSSEPRAEVTSGKQKSLGTMTRKAFPPDDKEKLAKAREQSQNNLKQLGIALHNFHDAYGQLPGPAILSKEGKPLLSWRVAILPFLEQEALYKKFKLDEPWDSPNNMKLLKEMPKVFEAPGVKASTPHVTFYQALVGKDALWQITPDKNKVHNAAGGFLGRIPDGTSNTIMLIEGAEPVPWTKPADITYDAKKALPKFGWFKQGFNVVMADGSARFVNRGVVSEKTLHAAITPNGGEVLGKDWDDPKGFQP